MVFSVNSYFQFACAYVYYTQHNLQSEIENIFSPQPDLIAAFIGEKDSLNCLYLVCFVRYRRKREFYAIDVFLCLAAILKKYKEKGKEVLKIKRKR